MVDQNFTVFCATPVLLDRLARPSVDQWSTKNVHTFCSTAARTIGGAIGRPIIDQNVDKFCPILGRPMAAATGRPIIDNNSWYILIDHWRVACRCRSTDGRPENPTTSRSFPAPPPARTCPPRRAHARAGGRPRGRARARVCARRMPRQEQTLFRSFQVQ